MLFLRSLAFAFIFYVGTFFWVVAALAMLPFAPRAILTVARGWSRYHRLCARILLGQKVRVIGTLPRGPALIVLKHESMFETIDLLCLFDRPMIAAKKELTDIPLWGWAGRRCGLIPIERDAGAAAMRALRKAAAQGLAEGRPICIFPEGTRVRHGESPPLRAGFAGLYALLKVPVVPIALDSGRVSPRGRFIKLPGIITYKVGETIPTGLRRGEAESRAHTAINALNGSGSDA